MSRKIDLNNESLLKAYSLAVIDKLDPDFILYLYAEISRRILINQTQEMIEAFTQHEEITGYQELHTEVARWLQEEMAT